MVGQSDSWVGLVCYLLFVSSVICVVACVPACLLAHAYEWLARVFVYVVVCLLVVWLAGCLFGWLVVFVFACLHVCLFVFVPLQADLALSTNFALAAGSPEASTLKRLSQRLRHRGVTPSKACSLADAPLSAGRLSTCSKDGLDCLLRFVPGFDLAVGQKYVAQMEIKTCGPIPGGLILTHTHLRL